MKSLCIIPARYASQRLHGKPLINLGEGAMIEVVYRRIASMELFNMVVVATDDTRISSFLEEKNIPFLMTSEDHISGTDRCAEVADKMPEYDIVVNVQGDEPLIEQDLLKGVLGKLKEEESNGIVTGISPLTDMDLLDNPNIVKVVISQSQNALLFSRSPIPCQRDKDIGLTFYRHIGIYGFKREILREVSRLEPCSLELTEKLEQLRWLYHDYKINCVVGPWLGFGIDTQDDVERYKSLTATLDKTDRRNAARGL